MYFLVSFSIGSLTKLEVLYVYFFLEVLGSYISLSGIVFKISENGHITENFANITCISLSPPSFWIINASFTLS